MAEIVPTILTNDKNLCRQQLETYSKFAKRIQVDICDGSFAPTLTIDESNIWWQQGFAPIDLHMMVMNPAQHLATILKIHPALVIFHAETNENLLPVFATLKQAGIKSGVAILKQTFPGDIAPYIQAADHCLIFAGRLGQQGGVANMLQTEKVSIIRGLKSDIEIGWDGGANLKNVRTLAHTGLDVINVGSAISNSPDPAKAYADLVAEADKQGVNI
ncbi:hypothetical protein IJH29_00040 [Candidatus Saccharibacteria bacterium]|nr:hypothetical protein [Candidatus Saccharibacteria bacterium]